MSRSRRQPVRRRAAHRSGWFNQPMTRTSIANREPFRAARASTTASFSCRTIAAARLRRSTRSAVKWMMSSTKCASRASPARSSPGGGKRSPRSTTARRSTLSRARLSDVVGPYHLEEARLVEIIDGMQMDLDYNAYPDFDALKVYCHRVAGVVGMLSARIFGFEDPRTLDYAADLGIAFQLTNIIRDVGEDARRNRVYLPVHELAEFGVTTDDIVHARETEAFEELMAFQARRAESWYEQAFSKLPPVDRKAQRPGIVMAAIYRTLLEEIRSDGCRVLTQRTSLTPIRKLWIAWKTWLTA